ncbi:hypothetical protein LP7551_04701 [Roseibium album]|nr:hypothetical protein LP7551_04701 [Roseibium album]
MRSLFVALLIVIFSGVHTAAAFGVAHMAASDVEHSTVMDHDQVDSADKAMSHQMKCCEKASDASSSSKNPGCSADCVSFVVSGMEVSISSSLTVERLGTPLLFALQVKPQDHPPKRL